MKVIVAWRGDWQEGSDVPPGAGTFVSDRVARDDSANWIFTLAFKDASDGANGQAGQ